MKTIWTILGTLMAASLFAQDNTKNLPPVPPPVSSPAAETAPAAPAPETVPATNPPAKHIKKHKVVKHTSAHTSGPAHKEPMVTLAPGTAQVAASELTVRGQAGLKGEAVARLSKGDTVNVLEQINLAHHAADEPSQWAKISFPKNGHVWVMAKYVNNGAVSTKKLNLRAGPGENYSVVGVIDQGATVNQIETKGEWMKIAPPDNAYAFVAAKFLTEEAAPPTTQVAVNPETPEVPPTPTPVPQPQPVITTPPPAPQPPPPPPQPTVRIVQHQGIVGPVGSVIAPTAYKLYDLDTGMDIDFLYPTSPDQDLHKLVDDKVIVTGEEGVDARWPNTPVIAIQNIQVIGKRVIKRLDLTPPKQRH